ncbi:MAG TPA: LPS export ABC transporter permease LptF [Rhodocyclaceae bacterium]|jgi:lipopolysaccharide export system permease protein|nr:LPS export ABC transporter permease LptF [Rhodocyclaceae bacterium]HMV21221.1 LPS export ABC transporter permease LptF [Rhodocyclaceae bacterium]HMW77130.1 LPS export ABC transporter permease LptF [Rhodocyclaceae bacterium]HNE43161.1 LPS export ABC transporter permease LptF [Rhodocyclaceae bacterium]HNL22617.1 LPS export ABC transporter permease LptF [Rhodocyclaceae bacterium]
MIFERAARREFAQAAAGISVVLLAILTSTQLIRLLNDAAGGRIAPEAVLALLGFSALNFLPILLSLTLFVAVLLSLSRAYRDSEMAVWQSCGLPLTAWLRPVLKFGFPIILVIALLSAVLSPWASLMSAEYKNKLASRNDATSRVTPGAFRETGQGQRVVFVEAMADDVSRVRNVFVAAVENGKLGVVMAATGHQEFMENGDRFMVLENGRRYEVEPGTPEFKIMDFERYGFRTEDSATKPADLLPSRQPLWDLLFDDRRSARGELVWRIGVPLSALILALMAVPLSYVNPRAGRSANMLIAILIYAIYSNLLSASQTWVAHGKLSFWLGVWAVHGLMLLPVAFMFYRRINLRLPRLGRR